MDGTPCVAVRWNVAAFACNSLHCWRGHAECGTHWCACRLFCAYGTRCVVSVGGAGGGAGGVPVAGKRLSERVFHKLCPVRNKGILAGAASQAVAAHVTEGCRSSAWNAEGGVEGGVGELLSLVPVLHVRFSWLDLLTHVHSRLKWQALCIRQAGCAHDGPPWSSLVQATHAVRSTTPRLQGSLTPDYTRGSRQVLAIAAIPHSPHHEGLCTGAYRHECIGLKAVAISR